MASETTNRYHTLKMSVVIQAHDNKMFACCSKVELLFIYSGWPICEDIFVYFISSWESNTTV